jgi:hypothetical protein
MVRFRDGKDKGFSFSVKNILASFLQKNHTPGPLLYLRRSIILYGRTTNESPKPA